MKKQVTQEDLSLGQHQTQLQNLPEFPTTQDTTIERKRLRRLIRLIQDEEKE